MSAADGAPHPRLNPVVDALLVAAGFALLAGVPMLIGGADAALWTLGAFAANMISGCGAMAWIDDEQQSLLQWYRQAPSTFIAAVVIQLWPVFVVARRMNREA